MCARSLSFSNRGGKKAAAAQDTVGDFVVSHRAINAMQGVYMC